MSEFLENRINRKKADSLLKEIKKRPVKPFVEVCLGGAVYRSSKFSSPEEFKAYLIERLNEDGTRLKKRADKT